MNECVVVIAVVTRELQILQMIGQSVQVMAPLAVHCLVQWFIYITSAVANQQEVQCSAPSTCILMSASACTPCFKCTF